MPPSPVVLDEAAPRHDVLVRVELRGPERRRDREAEALAGLDELLGPPAEQGPGQLGLEGVHPGDELLERGHTRIDQPLQPDQRQQRARVLDPAGGDADPAVGRPIAAGRPAQVVQVRPAADGDAVDEEDGEGRLEARGDALLGHDLDPAGRAVARQPRDRGRRREQRDQLRGQHRLRCDRALVAAEAAQAAQRGHGEARLEPLVGGTAVGDADLEGLLREGPPGGQCVATILRRVEDDDLERRPAATRVVGHRPLVPVAQPPPAVPLTRVHPHHRRAEVGEVAGGVHAGRGRRQVQDPRAVEQGHPHNLAHTSSMARKEDRTSSVDGMPMPVAFQITACSSPRPRRRSADRRGAPRRPTAPAP